MDRGRASSGRVKTFGIQSPNCSDPALIDDVYKYHDGDWAKYVKNIHVGVMRTDHDVASKEIYKAGKYIGNNKEKWSFEMQEWTRMELDALEACHKFS